MGLFDGIFNTKPQQQAAGDQINGINAGYGQLSDQFSQGRNAVTANYTAGLQPFQQNYTQANAGNTMYGNALGVNGAQGSADALKAFQSSNPGYQFQLDQGMNAVEANAAKNGQLKSGNTNLDLLKFGQGLANTTYGNWVQNLQPYLSNSTTNAAGIAQGYQGMGTALNNSFTNQGNAAYGAQTSIGNATANADLARSGANKNILDTVMGGAEALFGFADGGRPEAGRPAIVGERGPEIFVPDQPGTVIPHEQSFPQREDLREGWGRSVPRSQGWPEDPVWPSSAGGYAAPLLDMTGAGAGVGGQGIRALSRHQGLTDFATDEPGGNPFEVAASRVRHAAVSPRKPGPITYSLGALGNSPMLFHDMAKELMMRAMSPAPQAAAR